MAAGMRKRLGGLALAVGLGSAVLAAHEAELYLANLSFGEMEIALAGGTAGVILSYEQPRLPGADVKLPANGTPVRVASGRVMTLTFDSGPVGAEPTALLLTRCGLQVGVLTCVPAGAGVPSLIFQPGEMHPWAECVLTEDRDMFLFFGFERPPALRRAASA